MMDDIKNKAAITRKRWDLYRSKESDFLALAARDLRFLMGDQWDAEIKSQRQADRRPCLTHNRIKPAFRRVVGELRQSKISIIIKPGQNSDKDEAEITQGMVKAIWNESEGDIVVETAGDSLLSVGLGYARVITEYESAKSFNQVLRLRAIPNIWSVAVDPYAVDPTGEDANWAIVTETISEDDFKRRYPDKDIPSSFDDESSASWFAEGHVTLAELWEREYEVQTLYLLSDGSTQAVKSEKELQLPDGATVQDKRTVSVPKVSHYIVNGHEVLEGPTEWKGSTIPIARFAGETVIIDGQEYRSGIIRSAVDPQSMYNLAITATAEHIAKAPKESYMYTPTQTEGFEADWDGSNPSLMGRRFNPDNNVAGGAPIPIPPASPAPGLLEQAATGANDIEQTLGVFGAAMGKTTNETSGIAIGNRVNQTELSLYVFISNYQRGIARLGRIITEMIPIVYDNARIVTIVGQDDKEQDVPINQRVDKLVEPSGKVTYMPNEYGAHEVNMDSDKIYHVVIEAGPSTSTMREQAASGILEFMRVAPNVAAIAADIVADNSNWPGSDELAKRIRKTLPPGLASQSDNEQPAQQTEPPPPSPEMQMQAQMKQMELEIEKLRTQSAMVKAQTELEKAKIGAEDIHAVAREEAMKVLAEAVGTYHPADMMGGPDMMEANGH